MEPAQHDPAKEGASPEVAGKKKRGGLLYKLALASVGGVILAQEELTSFFRREPEPEEPGDGSQGDASQEDASEAETPSEPVSAEPTAATADWIDATINSVLKTLSVATRGQLQSLQREVQALEERIAALRSPQ